MRIAQIAPLIESVPPAGYGGTERVVSYLTEELVAMGHDVTLFASGDSQTTAHLVPGSPQALRLHGVRDPLPHLILLLEMVFGAAHQFDLLHFHCDYLHFPLSRRTPVPSVTTLHGRLDLPDLLPLYHGYMDQPLISISDAQRAPLPWANWVGTIHHGLPLDLYHLDRHPGDYLALLGRTSPEKGVERAVEIAMLAGLPLRLAAKVDPVDQGYFEHRIAPLVRRDGIDFVGEISQRQKQEFLGRARALLFPIEWPEPFGLVMIEALACGTPVIAFRRGSVPEIIEHGVTGYIVDDVAGAVDAVAQLDRLNREACRAAFEKRFTAGRMAGDYTRVYQALAGENTRSERPPSRLAPPEAEPVG